MVFPLRADIFLLISHVFENVWKCLHTFYYYDYQSSLLLKNEETWIFADDIKDKSKGESAVVTLLGSLTMYYKLE